MRRQSDPILLLLVVGDILLDTWQPWRRDPICHPHTGLLCESPRTCLLKGGVTGAIVSLRVYKGPCYGHSPSSSSPVTWLNLLNLHGL